MPSCLFRAIPFLFAAAVLTVSALMGAGYLSGSASAAGRTR